MNIRIKDMGQSRNREREEIDGTTHSQLGIPNLEKQLDGY